MFWLRTVGKELMVDGIVTGKFEIGLGSKLEIGKFAVVTIGLTTVPRIGLSTVPSNGFTTDPNNGLTTDPSNGFATLDKGLVTKEFAKLFKELVDEEFGRASSEGGEPLSNVRSSNHSKLNVLRENGCLTDRCVCQLLNQVVIDIGSLLAGFRLFGGSENSRW
jgi:hypothetical protein